MSHEFEPGFNRGEQSPNLPARESGANEPFVAEEISVKESIVIDEIFANGNLVEADVLKVLEVDIEGRKHKWHKETITTAEIASLGGWLPAEGVLHIDSGNCERTLSELEEVRIEVGVSFAKRVRFKRG